MDTSEGSTVRLQKGNKRREVEISQVTVNNLKKIFEVRTYI
jgi:site-specific recombinase XerC